jgi:MYXO-CTERM domain-containing protein
MKKSWMCVAMLAVAVALVLGAGTAEADTHGWAISDGSAGNWSDGSKWTPVGPPAADDTVHFNDDNQTEDITVDQNVTIASARVKWDNLSDANGTTWTVNLTDDGAGRTVNVTQGLFVMQGYVNGDHYSYNITANLNLSNLHLVLGSLSQRADLVVGQKTSVPQIQTVYGNLVVSGGSVTAYLDHFVIGRHTGGSGAARGTVDLSSCTEVMIDLDGNAYVGAYEEAGLSRYKYGTFKSGGGSVTVSGNLELSDHRTGGITGVGGEGRLYLDNTTFAVGGAARFHGRDWVTSSANYWERRFAQVYTTVAGSCSGLNLTRDDADALSFSRTNISGQNLNLIAIDFTADPTELDDDGWYWGMRWKGDYESDLEEYLNEKYARLTLDVSGLSTDVLDIHRDYLVLLGKHNGTAPLDANDFITYDSTTDYTYVGVYAYTPPPVSEPAGLGLLGLALLGLRKRRS